MQKLIIYLQSDHPDWVVMDGESVIQQSVPGGDKNELSGLAASRQVIVLVPAQDVLLTSAKLPKVSRSRLAQVLPFALEEQVIGEVETLHFVAGACQPDGAHPIAIVSKEKMQNWLNQLQALHVEADILMPLTLALPMEENSWVIVLHELAIVRMNEYQGFACECHNLHELLQAATLAVAEARESIHLYNYTRKEWTNTLSATMKVTEELHDETQFLVDIGKVALQFPYINLLQGMYKQRKSRFPEMHKLWKATIALAAAWFVLLFLYPTVSYFMLQHREHEFDSEIAEIYKRYFPAASSLVAPKLRLQEKLQAFTMQADENKLFLLMGTLGKGMKQARSITLKRLNFENKRMTLELTAASSEDFSRFTEALNHQGLTIKQDSANLLGSRVNAVITVE